MERRVERALPKPKNISRHFLDAAADAPGVHGLDRKGLQNQQVKCSLHYIGGFIHVVVPVGAKGKYLGPVTVAQYNLYSYIWRLFRLRVAMIDPHLKLRENVLERVLRGPGESDPVIRTAAANGTSVPTDLQTLVEKIHGHAYKVTDEDIARAQSKYTDDQLFEIVVCAALGASRQRLFAGLEALEKA